MVWDIGCPAIAEYGMGCRLSFLYQRGMIWVLRGFIPEYAINPFDLQVFGMGSTSSLPYQNPVLYLWNWDITMGYPTSFRPLMRIEKDSNNTTGV